MGLKSTLLSVFNNLIHQYLKLDPSCFEELKSHAGNSILVQITDIQQEFLIFFTAEKGLQLKAEKIESPTTVIRGKLFALLAMLEKHPEGKTIFPKEISLSGDLDLAQEMKKILGKMDIDWEEHLSQYLGDVGSNRVVSTLQRASRWFQKLRTSLSQNTVDFLQEESRYLIHPLEMEKLSKEVSELRNGVERAFARIRQLQKNVGESS